MSFTRFATDQALPKLATAIRPSPSIRSGGELRCMRPGLAATSTRIITTSTAGSSHRSPIVNRAGRNSCRTIMTMTAKAPGQRCSPSVCRRQAGTNSWSTPHIIVAAVARLVVALSRVSPSPSRLLSAPPAFGSVRESQQQDRLPLVHVGLLGRVGHHHLEPAAPHLARRRGFHVPDETPVLGPVEQA